MMWIYTVIKRQMLTYEDANRDHDCQPTGENSVITLATYYTADPRIDGKTKVLSDNKSIISALDSYKIVTKFYSGALTLIISK
ncbi:hypothetical protein Trydic_g20872 [Trypoxylus dichotomus]